MHLLAMCRSVFGREKESIQILCPFINWTVWHFSIELYQFFKIRVLTPHRHLIRQCFLPFSGLPLHIVGHCLGYAEAFQFDVVLNLVKGKTGYRTTNLQPFLKFVLETYHQTPRQDGWLTVWEPVGQLRPAEASQNPQGDRFYLVETLRLIRCTYNSLAY